MRARPAVFIAALAGLWITTAAPAQEHQAPAGEAKEAAAHEGAGHGNLEIWKWANFLLLAGGIGYFIGKHAGPYFSARSRQIRQAMAEAEEQRSEAEQRVAAVDKKLASLDSEIAALREEAQREAASEHETMRQQTAAEIAKIRQQAVDEVAMAGKTARLELKSYSAQLALEAAQRKIEARMTPDTQDALVKDFVHDLGAPENRQ